MYDNVLITLILFTLVLFGAVTLHFITRVHEDMNNMRVTMTSVEKHLKSLATFKTRGFKDCDVYSAKRSIQESGKKSQELAEYIDSA